jgi:hypothetical protein
VSTISCYRAADRGSEPGLSPGADSVLPSVGKGGNLVAVREGFSV